MEEINEDREEHGKKPFDDTNRRKKESLMNRPPTQNGVFHKGEHKMLCIYSKTACDKKGYI
ncbi:MAG: hypothetical protein ACLS48_11950 [[Eubacterium] siraeum]